MHNAIVIMFDTLQRDYVGCYGNDWIKTPNMDRLAREGAVFDNFYTEGLPTVPCRRAMLTGRYTLPVAGWVPLSMEDTTIADLCWGRPIDTALIFDCPMFRQSKFGYTRGFDKVWFIHGHEGDHVFYDKDALYHMSPEDYITESVREGAAKQYGEDVVAGQIHEISCYLKLHQYWKTEEDRYVCQTVSNAITYLEQVDRNKQFFLWIDSFDPHEPWDPPSVYRGEPCPYDPDWDGKNDFLPFLGDCDGVYDERTLHHIHMLYAELVTLCDKQLGRLMDAIRKLGLEDSTLLWVVSDHGSPMGFGKDGHGIMRKVRPWPYQELVHTPSIIRIPGAKPGQRIKGFTSSVDVAPTVCDWLGIGVHPDMQGKSLLPLVFGEVKKVRDFAIAGYHKYSVALYCDGWSFIHWTANERHTSGFNQDMREFQKDHFKFLGVDKLPLASAITGDGKVSLSMASGEDAAKIQKAMATLDGEAQWTCTPGSIAKVPEMDELYDREKDPYQLNNIMSEYPEKAAELFTKLRAFMDDLAHS